MIPILKDDCLLDTEWPLTRPCPCKLCIKMQAAAKQIGEYHQQRILEICQQFLIGETK